MKRCLTLLLAAGVKGGSAEAHGENAPEQMIADGTFTVVNGRNGVLKSY